MKRQKWQSALRAIVAIAVAMGLLLVLIAPGHASASLSCILFLPILIAGIVIIPAVLGRLKEADPRLPKSVFGDLRCFQRPPPTVLA